MAGGFSISDDGRVMAFTAGSPTSLTEVFVADRRRSRRASSPT